MIADWEVNVVFLAAMLKVRHPELFTQLHSILTSHGVEVRLLENVRDIWAKDYCPVQVLPRTLVKFCYAPDYLKHEPELRTGDEVLTSLCDMGWCNHSDIILDGGNVVGSRSKAIVTEKIYRENAGWIRSRLRNKLQKLLHVDQLIVIPKEPFDPIGHADGMVRFIDEHSVLVNDYSKVDPGFGERLCKVLRDHHLAIEALPHFHEKRTRAGIPSAVGCYINFLMTEKVLIAPVYETIDDAIALRKLESVFPGMPIIPLDCTNLAREGGILNCVSASFRRSP
ncbi:MAG: agmatine deiminase family protein [Gemmataceae bacterium]